VVDEKSRIGRAGEHLVAFYLLQYCDSVILTNENSKADLILDHSDRLYKVQVKSTNSIWKHKGKEYYRWDFRPGRYRPDDSEKIRYTASDVDIYALVAIPLGKVLFIPYNTDMKSISKRIEDFDKLDTRESLEEALNIINHVPTLKPFK
jgi:hypothetical protein